MVRKRKWSHIRRIREQINKKATETAKGNPQIKRLHHLWITMELKEYFGVRYFEEIPLEFEQLCIDLVNSYRKTWSIAKEIGSLISYTF